MMGKIATMRPCVAVTKGEALGLLSTMNWMIELEIFHVIMEQIIRGF